MRKAILICTALFVAVLAKAQDKNVQSARDYLGDKDYENAKLYIDKAIEDPTTKEKPKTWETRGEIYYSLQLDPKHKNEKLYREATKSFMKVVQLKADYEKEAVTANLFSCAIMYYNDGIEAFNSKKYDDAIENMKNVVDIHSLDGGKRFSPSAVQPQLMPTMKMFDTIAAKSLDIEAISAYYANKFDEALPLLIEDKNNAITRSVEVYRLLDDLYRTKKKDAEFIAIIDEGKSKFPNDKGLIYDELNYYITSGKQTELQKKLEDGVKNNPNDATLVFDLGKLYDQMANPIDASGRDAAKPSNYDELFGKAESSYLNTLKIAPDSIAYNYNLGALYYNKAAYINKQMADVPLEQQKKYDELDAKYTALFNQALPFLEKTATLCESKGSNLTSEDKNSYKQSLIALREIYRKQKKADKSKQADDKLNTIK